MSTATNPLARLTTPDAYQAERAQVFPSQQSLRWFMRTRRERLVKASAVLVLNGRMVIDPQAFDQVVIEVGNSQAQASAYGRKPSASN